VLPFVADEVANDVSNALAPQVLIAEDTLDHLIDQAQTPRSLLMLGFENRLWSPLRQDRAP
jgi:hypothetical protein